MKRWGRLSDWAFREHTNVYAYERYIGINESQSVLTGVRCFHLTGQTFLRPACSAKTHILLVHLSFTRKNNVRARKPNWAYRVTSPDAHSGGSRPLCLFRAKTEQVLLDHKQPGDQVATTTSGHYATKTLRWSKNWTRSQSNKRRKPKNKQPQRRYAEANQHDDADVLYIDAYNIE